MKDKRIERIDESILKQKEELKEGWLRVISRNKATGQLWNTRGAYNDKFEVVFFTIPSTREVLGYIQE